MRLAEILAFLRRDMLIAVRYPTTLYMPFVTAIVTIASFAYVARLIDPHSPLREGGHAVPYLTYVVINMAFMLLLTTALTALGNNLRRDQMTGTLQATFQTGASNTIIAFGSMAWPMVIGLASTASYFVIGAAFGMRLEQCNIPMLILFIILGAGSMATLGILAAVVVLQYKQPPPSSFFIGGGAALFAGVLFPVKLLPIPMQIVSWLLPMTHALNGFRGALLGATNSSLLPDAIWLAVVTACLLPVSLALFSRALRIARFDGTLANY